MDWHATQSSHNIDCSAYLTQKNPLYKDWEIITLFYSAIHRVDSYFLLTNKQIPDNHNKRRKLVCSELHEIFREYKSLERLSQQARYECTFNDLSSSYVQLAVQLHNTIATFVNQKLQESGHAEDTLVRR